MTSTIMPKRLSISKYLSKVFGGKWVYDGTSSWWNEETKRHLARVAGCSCDDDYCNAPPRYILYSPEGAPRDVYFIEDFDRKETK